MHICCWRFTIIGDGHDRPGQTRADKGRPGQMRKDHGRPGQIRTHQDRPGEIRAEQSYLTYLEIPEERAVSHFCDVYCILNIRVDVI